MAVTKKLDPASRLHLGVWRLAKTSMLTACLALATTSADAAVVKILTSTKASAISGADADDDLDAFYQGLGATSW